MTPSRREILSSVVGQVPFMSVFKLTPSCRIFRTVSFFHNTWTGRSFTDAVTSVAVIERTVQCCCCSSCYNCDMGSFRVYCLNFMRTTRRRSYLKLSIKARQDSSVGGNIVRILRASSFSPSVLARVSTDVQFDISAQSRGCQLTDDRFLCSDGRCASKSNV